MVRGFLHQTDAHGVLETLKGLTFKCTLAVQEKEPISCEQGFESGFLKENFAHHIYPHVQNEDKKVQLVTLKLCLHRVTISSVPFTNNIKPLSPHLSTPRGLQTPQYQKKYIYFVDNRDAFVKEYFTVQPQTCLVQGYSTLYPIHNMSPLSVPFLHLRIKLDQLLRWVVGFRINDDWETWFGRSRGADVSPLQMHAAPLRIHR